MPRAPIGFFPLNRLETKTPVPADHPPSGCLSLLLQWLLSGCLVFQNVMSPLEAFGRLYSVETLDTRFTTSSKSLPSEIDPAKPLKESSSSSPENQYNGASPPKWKTLEFGLYGLVFLVAVPWMFYTVYDVSQRTSTHSDSHFRHSC